MTKRQHILTCAHLVVSLAPWLNLLAFAGYALAARIALGHYPHQVSEFAGSDRPPLSCFFDGLVWWTQIWLFLSVPVWLGLTIWRVARWKDWTIWRPAVIIGLGYAATQIIYSTDPVGFFKWLDG